MLAQSRRHPPCTASLQQLQRVLHIIELAQAVVQGATVGPTMAEGMHMQYELESIARTQRQIDAHKMELTRMEHVEHPPDLWPALPPGDLSAAAVIQERQLQLYAADIDRLACKTHVDSCVGSFTVHALSLWYTFQLQAYHVPVYTRHKLYVC